MSVIDHGSRYDRFSLKPQPWLYEAIETNDN